MSLSRQLHPTNPLTLFAATSNGLVKTTDGFQTHSTVFSGDIIDIEFHPTNANIVYISNNSNNTIYRSTNLGDSFVSTGVILVDKPQIAVSKNQPNSVFVADDGLFYKSTNNGLSFTKLGNPDEGIGQYGGFAVSDTNANIIVNGSLNT